MPEESFEQQARTMADGFSREPQPAVWQRVQAAITPPKRKRRAIFWWWLLPLCLAGGAAVLFLNQNKKALNNKTFSASENYKKPLLTNKTSVATPGKTRLQKKENFTALSNQKNLQKQNAIIDKKNNKSQVSFQKNETDRDVKSNHSDEKRSAEEETTLAMEGQKRMAVIVTHNSVADSSRIGVVDTSTKAVKDEAAKPADALQANAVAAVKPTDSAQQKSDTALAVGIHRKKNKKTDRIGVMAEIGTASWGNKLFSSKEQSKSLTSSTASPGNYLASPGSNIDFLRGTTTIQYQIKKGRDAALGLSIQKDIGKKVFVSGQLAYRYQKFMIARTIFVDTSTGNTTGNDIGGAFYNLSETQQFHFANFYTAIGWKFFNKRKTALALQTGLDNSWLIALQTKHNGQLQPQLVSLKSLSAADFQRWQPHINTSISFDWQAGKQVHFQLSPFARFGLRTFQKSIASYKDNHLVSAGIQVNYFFK